VKQLAAQILAIRSSGSLPVSNDRSIERYSNTLLNLGVIQEAPLALTQTGLKLAAFLDAKSLAPEDLRYTNRSSDIVEFEKIIFRELVEKLCETPEGESKSLSFFRGLLHNLQLLIDNIPEGRRNAIADDLDFLLFLQLIHSTGFEVGRFFRLDSVEENEARSAWDNLVESFPANEPTDPIGKMLYVYVRPRAKNTIQADIRYRVQPCVKSYLALRDEMGQDFPRLNSRLQIVNRIAKKARNRMERFLLPDGVSSPPLPYPRQWIICGCPGSGKSRYLDGEAKKTDPAPHIIRTTFHQETSYFDFVGTYKPSPVYEKVSSELFDLTGSPFIAGRPVIDYRFLCGPLLEATIKATLNPGHNVILIIEEINRANCGAVFGDMFQLLDRNSDGTSTYSIEPSPDLRNFLASLGTPLLRDTVRLPANLYIWATMNSADQGVRPIDSAFRRRWEFEYRGHRTPCEYPSDAAQIVYAGTKHNWDSFRELVNRKLSTLAIHEDKLIGPYFLTVQEMSDPAKILNKLLLYLWEDVLRFQQKELMDFDSFSHVQESWDNGKGDPLGIANDLSAD
jgi:hypothetical protein